MSSRAKKKARYGIGTPAAPAEEKVPKKKSKTKKIILISSLVLVGLILIAALLNLIFSWNLIHTWITPEKSGWTQSPAAAGLWYETFELETPNGFVRGWIMKAQQPTSEEDDEIPAPKSYSDKTVIFAPNYDSTREVLDLGGVECFADFCAAGYNVVTFDWTGSGHSEGDENAFLLDKTEELQIVTDYAVSQTGADFVAIQSIGFACYPAACVTADTEAVDALILDSCYKDFSNVLYDQFDVWAGSYDLAPIRATVKWLFPILTDVDPASVSLTEPFSKMNGKYLFFIQGGSDEIFGVDGAKELCSLAGLSNKASSWILSGVGHVRARSYDAGTYFMKISEFLKKAQEDAKV